jgi:succinyl-CoA synthetase beta subunit
MRLLEYQAKEALGDFGIAVPAGALVRSSRDVEAACSGFGPRVVVKAQVRQDGRGKAGGILMADGPTETRESIGKLLGQTFRGETVKSVLVEERLNVAAELYLGVATDRERGCPAAIVGSAGGIDVALAAAERPETLARVDVDMAFGLGDYQARYLVWKAGTPAAVSEAVATALRNLYRLYRGCDATFAEINPLVVTTDGELVAADARLDVDDGALFRQPRFADLRELTPLEARVERAGFHYVETDGEVGIISTGSGACMAIMDMLAAAGARPANFMELGQSMSHGGAETATELLLARHGLRAILVAGYSGGALDRLVAGVLDVLGKRPEPRVPVVISLQGRNDEQAMAVAAASADPRVRAIEGIADAVRVVGSLVSDEGRGTNERRGTNDE